MQALDADPVNILECDVRIARLRAEICHVQTIRNSYLPISCLPTEVLCKIFICVRNLSRWYRRVSNSGPAVIPPFIKSTTHVCCHWRIAAINCPELWSRITFNGPQKWVTLQLQRAKKSLLSIVLSPGMQVNHMLRSCLSQLQSLKITQATSRNLKQYGTTLTGAQTPFLERLEISMSAGIREKDQHLPVELFAKGIPSLRHLSLRVVILRFTSPIFKGLCSLTFTTLYPSTVDLAQFLDALDSSPNLEHFEVQFKFPEQLSCTPRPQAVILPKIKSFQLSGTITTCTAIVKHLILPTSAMLKIVIRDPPVNSLDALTVHKELCTAIKQAWLSDALQTGHGSVLPSQLRTMEYECDSSTNTDFCLRFWLDDRQCFPIRDSIESDDSDDLDSSASDDSDDPLDPTGLGAALEITPEVHAYDTKGCAEYMVKALPIENVTSATIFGCSSPRKWIWTSLGRLSSLTYLCLYNNSANSFFVQALSGPAPAVNDFPHLTHINFYNVDFGLAQCGHCLQDKNTDVLPVHFNNQLMRFLRLRKKHGASIRKLGFKLCSNFTYESFKAVTQLVWKVDWNFQVERRDKMGRSCFGDHLINPSYSESESDS